MDTTQLLTRSQVACRLGVSSEYVRSLALAGRLPFLDTPLGRLFDPAAVEAFAVTRGQHRERGAK